jgi:hypothetical protein
VLQGENKRDLHPSSIAAYPLAVSSLSVSKAEHFYYSAVSCKLCTKQYNVYYPAWAFVSLDTTGLDGENARTEQIIVLHKRAEISRALFKKRTICAQKSIISVYIYEGLDYAYIHRNWSVRRSEKVDT